jgi:hypothetical protein
MRAHPVVHRQHLLPGPVMMEGTRQISGASFIRCYSIHENRALI